MTSSNEPIEFSPFYDPRDRDASLTVGGKVFVSVAAGGLYVMTQYLMMSDKGAFFEQYCWILGVIISTCLMSLYVATDIFRSNLHTIDSMQGNDRLTRRVIGDWLTDSRFIIAGLFFGMCNTVVAHALGIPGDLHAYPLSLSVMYIGYFFAGFTAGMGMLAIFAVIALYLNLAPELDHSLDSDRVDATTALKQLNNSLLFFATLISLVGVLVSMYMFAVDWQLMHLASARMVFLFWISLPYVVAISVVLLPNLAVSRQVSYYKNYRINQLKQEKSKLHLSLKKFEVSDDESIIQRQRDIGEKLNTLNTKIAKLKKLRSYHNDSSEGL